MLTIVLIWRFNVTIFICQTLFLFQMTFELVAGKKTLHHDRNRFNVWVFLTTYLSQCVNVMSGPEVLRSTNRSSFFSS